MAEHHRVRDGRQGQGQARLILAQTTAETEQIIQPFHLGAEQDVRREEDPQRKGDPRLEDLLDNLRDKLLHGKDPGVGNLHLRLHAGAGRQVQHLQGEREEAAGVPLHEQDDHHQQGQLQPPHQEGQVRGQLQGNEESAAEGGDLREEVR